MHPIAQASLQAATRTWESILRYWDTLDRRRRALTLVTAFLLLVAIGRVSFRLHAHDPVDLTMSPETPVSAHPCTHARVPGGCVREGDFFCLQAQATDSSPSFVYALRASGLSLIQAPGASKVNIRLTYDQASSRDEKPRIIQVADAYLAIETPPTAPIYVDGPAALCIAARMHAPLSQ
jgi:hypothetical protein